MVESQAVVRSTVRGPAGRRNAAAARAIPQLVTRARRLRNDPLQIAEDVDVARIKIKFKFFVEVDKDDRAFRRGRRLLVATLGNSAASCTGRCFGGHFQAAALVAQASE